MRRALPVLCLLAACHSHSEIRAEKTLEETTVQNTVIDKGPVDEVITKRVFAVVPPPAKTSGTVQHGGGPSRAPVQNGVPSAVPATGEFQLQGLQFLQLQGLQFLVEETVTARHYGPERTAIGATDTKTEKSKGETIKDSKPSAGCIGMGWLFAIGLILAGLAAFALLRKFS